MVEHSSLLAVKRKTTPKARDPEAEAREAPARP